MSIEPPSHEPSSHEPRSDEPSSSAAEPLDASLARALFDVAATPEPAPALRLEAVLAARPAGSWIGFTDGDDITAVEAYRREAARFEALLSTLSPAHWLAPVVTYGDTRTLVAHLAAIEHYVGSQLGLWPLALDDSLDHVAIGRSFIEARADSTASQRVGEWRSLVGQVLDAFDAQPLRLAEAATWHGAPVTFEGLLLIRTFELWTHGDDVRRAIGSDPVPPDNAQLKLMTNLAASVLPLGLAIAGRTHACLTLRLVLTGPGGGTWRVGLAPGAAAAIDDDLLVVADAVDFCRLAANRLDPVELAPYVEGDEAVAADVFEGMRALAVD